MLPREPFRRLLLAAAPGRRVSAAAVAVLADAAQSQARALAAGAAQRARDRRGTVTAEDAIAARRR